MAVDQFSGMDDDEQGLPIFFDFGPLMSGSGVLDGEFMQAKFMLHFCQFFLRRIFQRDPDKALGQNDEFTDVDYRYIGKLFTVLVSDAID